MENTLFAQLYGLIYKIEHYTDSFSTFLFFLFSECGKSFSTPSSLKTHVNKDHPSEETLNQIECKCHQCDKSFNSAIELNQHLVLEHMQEGKFLEFRQLFV